MKNHGDTGWDGDAFGRASISRIFDFSGVSYTFDSDDYSISLYNFGPGEERERHVTAGIPTFATNNLYNIMSMSSASLCAGDVCTGRGFQLVTGVWSPPSMEQVAHIGIASKGIFVQGDYAYVAAGKRGLRILDISDPTNPSEIGFYDEAGDDPLWIIERVEVSGNYAYLVSGIRGMYVIDVSDPAKPVRVGVYSLPDGFVSDVKVSGEYAYVTWSRCYYSSRCDEKVYLVDISDPTNPVETGIHYDMTEAGTVLEEAYHYRPGMFRERATMGDYTYVLYQGYYLKILDSNNPDSSFSTGYRGEKIALANGYVYLHTGRSIQILDVSDPVNPTEIGVYELPGGKAPSTVNYIPEAVNYIEDAMIAGDYMYVATNRSGLRIVDISDARSPVEVGTYGAPGYAQDVEVSGNHAYVADKFAGLLIYDVSDPYAPVEVGRYDESGGIDGVAPAGDYVYVCADELHILDVSDPYAPSDVAAYQGDCQQVGVSGNYLYAILSETLQVMDISDPANPVKVTPPDGVIDAQAFQLANGYLYTLPPFYTVLYNETCQEVSRSLLDVYDPVSLEKSSSYEQKGCLPPDRMAVIGDRAYVHWAMYPISGGGPIEDWKLIDLSDPADPRSSGEHILPVVAHYEYSKANVIVAGDYAYFADGATPHIYDLSGDDPVEVDSLGALVWGADAEVTEDGYVYLANSPYPSDESDGLYIMRYPGR